MKLLKVGDKNSRVIKMDDGAEFYFAYVKGSREEDSVVRISSLMTDLDYFEVEQPTQGTVILTLKANLTEIQSNRYLEYRKKVLENELRSIRCELNHRNKIGKDY